MRPSTTHHRAVALLLAVASVLGLARAARPRAVALPPERPPAPPREGPVDPQTADARALESLPGVGPALARRIVEARARGLAFRRPEDLLRVRGIGPATLARLRPRLVTGRAAASPPRSP